MDSVSFVVPGKPQGKARPRVVRQGGYSHAFTPDATRDYEDAVIWAFAQATAGTGFNLFEGPVKAEIEARFEIPKSVSQKRREEMLRGEPYLHKPDCDNIAKIILDALNGIAYRDDACVWKIEVRKCYSEKECTAVKISNIKFEGAEA